MPKQINVKLGFEADTSQAKKQIQDLQKSLDNLMTSSMKNTSMQDFSKGMIEAQQSAVKLKSILGESMNIDTGRLDLVKFNQQLQDSGLTLSKLGSQLSSLGPEGKQAFLNLADSIVTAQKPMIETNKLLDGMWTALKNTARWQLSSSILHGFMSSLQSAYGYAQDLNASLNSIRIVSGQSVEQMAAFADQANKSAQALSTSTLAYTDAALIFYQQGLTGDAVTERVDTVLKLSNVTGDSAEQVSSYMTAIWNNFYDGSQSLESFADKITALGAATASSSAEISAGLQQFASVADTVGLSYDYAASALATIVSQTRQSESTVGNGLRTIFSRLQGLKLGDTLEDGTDLTKYSEALLKVGVNIKDQNGELKNMDTILDELGAKWQSLAQDQKVALATTVAGVRQYVNFIALLDNYDKFQQNVEISRNAEGALQEQADIYAESWEAARKRVQTAWQAIYQDLIDDKFFIWLTNAFASILKGVDGLIDSIGGLKGVLAAVGTVATTVFGKQLESGLKNAQTNINKIFFSDEIANYNANEAVKAAEEQLSTKYEDQAQNAIIENQIYQIKLNNELRQIQKDLNADKMEYYQTLVKNTGEMAKQYSLAIQEQQIASKENLDVRKSSLDSVYGAWANNDKLDTSKWEGILSQDINNADYKEFLENIRNTKDIEEVIKHYTNLGKEFDLTSEKIRKLVESEKRLDEARKNAIDLGNKQKIIEDGIAQAKEKNIPVSQSILNIMVDEASTLQATIQEKEAEILADGTSQEKKEALEQEIKSLTAKYEALTNAISQYNAEQVESELDPSKKKQASPGLNLDMQGLTYGIQGISQMTLAVTSLNKAFDVLEDPDLSWIDKLVKVLPSVATGISSVTMALSSFEKFKNSAIFTQLGGAFKTLGTQFINLFINPSIAGLQAFGATMMHTVAPILAVVAAIWLIKKAWDAYQASTPEGKLKAAREELEKATEKAKEAKQAYDDLKSTFESYNDLKENINDMDETDRAKAVAEMNSEMLDLITNTENWATIFKDGIEYDENGLIKITEAQEELLRKEEAKAYFAAQRLETEKKIIELNAEEKKEDSDLSFQFKKFANGGNVTSEVLDALANNNLQGLKDYDSLIQNAKNKDIPEEEKNDEIEKLRKLQQEQSESIKQALLEAGFSEEEIEGNLLPQIENVISNEDALKEMVSAILDHISNNSQENAYQDQANRDYFSSIENKDESGETYNAFNELSSESQQTVLDWYQKLDETQKDYFDNAMENGENMIATIKHLEEEYENLGNISDELTRKAAESNEIIHGSLSDSDIDEEEFANLSDFFSEYGGKIEGLSEDLSKYKEDANDLAESILRFDDAIQDVTKHSDEWSHAMSTGSLQDKAEAISQMKDAYADMLDVSEDAFTNIPGFLENTENLELMKQAAEGVKGAYEQLQQNLQSEILAKVGLDDSEFQSKYADVIAMSNTELADMQIGAYLDDTQVIDALNNMIQSMDLTEAEAEALLQSMGWDADVEQVEVPESQQQAFIDAVPHVDYPETAVVPTVINDSSGTTLSAEPTSLPVPRITYDPIKQTEESEGEKTVTMLRIKSAKKSAGGNFKYSNAKHGGGSGGSKGGGSKGGGGGGNKGSSTPKKKTVKEHKDPKKEEDRYHDLKELIDDVNTALTRLGKTKDRVYGKSKLKYLDQEIAKQKEQIALTKEYIKEGQRYLALDRAKLAGIQKGAKYDENGMLINYEEVLKNITDTYNNSLAEYNKAVDKFNASAQEEGDSAALEAAEKALAAAEKEFEENKKILKQYEDTYNLIQENQEKLQDQLEQYYDLLLEVATTKVTIEIDLDKSDVELLQWLYKYLGDSADKGADKIANLSKQIDKLQHQIEVTQQGITDIMANHGIAMDYDNLDPAELVSQLKSFFTSGGIEGMTSELTQAEAEQIKTYLSDMMNYYDEMYDKMKESNEVVREALDGWNERLEDLTDNFDKARDAVEHYTKVIELTGRKELKMTTDQRRQFDKALIENDKNYLASLQDTVNSMAQEVARAQESYNKALASGNEDVIKETEETLRKAQDLYDDWLNSLRNQTEKTLEDINEAEENSLNLMIEDYKEALNDLDVLLERYNRQKENDHLYLDDYEKYHELNGSMKELEKSIAKTNNTMIKGKMADLQDEINAKMQSGVKISEREAEIIARRIALLQAEAELKDAQNAKSAVRMTRDNEGNFSYTYTADQEQVGEAEGNYADKFYDLLKYERDEIENIEAERLQAEQQFADDLMALHEAYRNGEISSEEEYYRLLEELRALYQERMNYYSDQEAMLFEEQARLRDDDWQDFENLLGLKLAEQNDFVTEFEETITGRIQPGYQTLEDEQVKWAQAMSDGFDIVYQAAEKWREDSEQVYNILGTSMDNFAIKSLIDLTAVQNASNLTAQASQLMNDAMVAAMEAIIAESDLLNQEWAADQGNMRNEIAETVSALNDMFRKLNETIEKEQDTQRESKITQDVLDTTAKVAEDAEDALDAAADAAREAAQAARDAAQALRELAGAGATQDTTGSGHPGGCFDPGTKITMFDGSEKNIEDIHIGDIILSYNELTKKYEPQKVIDTMIHHNTVEMLDVYFSNGQHLGLTACHPILTSTGWKSLNYEMALFEHWIKTMPLKVGQRVIGLFRNNFINKIEWRKDIPNYNTYNISIENVHTYIANGVVVHNAQNKWVDDTPSRASGGYTGAWGPEGVVNILHEKEYVLNKDDTANIFKVVDIVRELDNKFGLSQGLNNFANSIIGSSSLAMAGSGVMDQNVHIEANFPNVQSHTEIEMAINNLINSASQYVNRKS